MKYIIFISILCLGLLGCAQSSSPAVKYYPRYDFTQIKSYSFYPLNSSFTDIQNLNAGLRNVLEISLEHRLNSFGLVYKPLAEADIVVSYYFMTPSKKRFDNYNKEVKYCGHCLPFYTGHAKKKSWGKTPGNLVLDLIDNTRGRTIWRSIYPTNLQSDDHSQKTQERLSQAISTMLYVNPKELTSQSF